MNNCQLKSLTNLPDIPNLTRIELMGNVFEPSEIQKLSKYKKLECVSIGDNKINSINDLKPLTGIDSIVQLDFSGTKFSETSDYREKVFEHFPNLIILDNKDKDGNSYQFESEEEY